jgi:hypothetical protein
MRAILAAFISLSVYASILPSSALAAQAGTEEAEGEVIRVEDLSRHQLNTYIEEAEEQFYAIFNSINSNDGFDIHCRKDTRVGSNIPVRNCQPRFLTDAMAGSASDYMFDIQTLTPDQGIVSNAKPELELLKAEMAELIASNAQLREIAGILNLLRARRAQL